MKNLSDKEIRIIVEGLSDFYNKNVVFDKKDGKFWVKNGVASYVVVPNNIVTQITNQNKESLEKARDEINLVEEKNKINNFYDNYCDAVNYFYQKAFFDNNGFFVIKDTKKKYLTGAQLDDLLEKFKERKLKSKYYRSEKIKRLDDFKEDTEKNHIESEEDHVYVWTCDYCGKEFDTKAKSDEHEIICDKNPQKDEPTEIADNKAQDKNYYNLAIWSFVLSIISIFLGLLGWIGLFMGINALVKLPSANKKGRTYAIIAIVICSVFGPIKSLLGVLARSGY